MARARFNESLTPGRYAQFAARVSEGNENFSLDSWSMSLNHAYTKYTQ